MASRQLELPNAMSAIRALHISTSTKGGAPAAMLRITKALQSEEIEISGCFFHGESPGENWTRLKAPTKSTSHPIYRFKMSHAKKGREQSLESFTPTNARRTLKIPKELIEKCNVVNLHYLGGQIWDQEALFKSIPPQKPIVVTMHDIHQISGGCHYANGCDNYTTGCAQCPQLPGRFGKSLCSESYRLKEQLFSSRSITLVTPSRWLEGVSKSSKLGKIAESIEHIGYPFPEYKTPIPREEAREQLSLNDTTGEKLVLLVAQDLANKRKGTGLLIEALQENRLPNCRLLLIGKKINTDNPRIHQLGFLKDRSTLRAAYAAADVLCLPSIEENLAQTGIESLSEGTPVVCFKGTGPNDYVVEQKTGRSAEVKNSRSLARALLAVVADSKLSDQREVYNSYCEIYTKNYAPKIIREKYNTLYKRLLASAVSGEARH